MWQLLDYFQILDCLLNKSSNLKMLPYALENGPFYRKQSINQGEG